jgi:hypothetical protein
MALRWYLWGLNPRRLECLADLKSAPLDHSGKIPGQSDSNAPIRTRPFLALLLLATPCFGSVHRDCYHLHLPGERSATSLHCSTIPRLPYATGLVLHLYTTVRRVRGFEPTRTSLQTINYRSHLVNDVCR